MPEGSAEALAAHLTERFWMRLRMFAVRRLKDRNAAEDVAQETIRRVLEALRDQRIRNLDALPAFVFQTARNICLHEARSARREGAALFMFGGNQATTTGPEDDPVTSLIDRARREEVRAATQRLGPEDRELLQLLYGDGADNAEIARRLGIDPGALRVRKHRALKRLALLLGEDVTAETIPAERELRDGENE
ncbi:MAG: sigma-70 family RNA polymerase sigma factor [Acidobacteriota bacterium]